MNLKFIKQYSPKILPFLLTYFKSSKFWIFVLVVLVVKINLDYKLWIHPEKRLIDSDVVGYYAYLPATIIEKDLSFKFFTADYLNKNYDKVMYWPLTAPNGGKIIKMTMGVSICYLPFFLMAHAYSHFVLNIEPKGFEDHYEFALICSSMFFFMLSLIYLRKILINQNFPETIIIITLLLFSVGSNLLNYTTNEPVMAHVYVFSLGCMLVYHIINWHQTFQFRFLVYVGFLLGLMTLIRPTSILYALFFILFNVTSWASIKHKMIFFQQHFFKLLIIPILGFLCLLPLFLYWKIMTGHFLFNSYIGERFFFDRPMIIPGLFSYRKGWFLYTPVFVFTIIGLFRMVLKKEKLGVSILITFSVILYVIFSWSSWYYGGGISARALIDFYPLLIIPSAYFIQSILLKKDVSGALQFTLLIATIAFGALKNYQYRNGTVHYDGMNKKLYWQTFLSTKMPPDFHDNLTMPDENRTMNGQEEYHFNIFRND